MARSLLMENLLPQNVGSIINYLQQSTEVANGELLVAVDHNQLWIIASETVASIVWSHLPPSWAAPPECLVHSINLCSSATARIRSCNFATFSMRDNHLAYAAAQGTQQILHWRLLAIVGFTFRVIKVMFLLNLCDFCCLGFNANCSGSFDGFILCSLKCQNSNNMLFQWYVLFFISLDFLLDEEHKFCPQSLALVTVLQFYADLHFLYYSL